jgi:hypothetical protein
VQTRAARTPRFPFELVAQRLPGAALTGRAIAAGLPTFPLRAPFGSHRGGGYGLLEHGARRLFALGGDGEHLGPADEQPATVLGILWERSLEACPK